MTADDVRRAMRRIKEKRTADERHAYIVAALIYRSDLGLIERGKLDLLSMSIKNELQKATPKR